MTLNDRLPRDLSAMQHWWPSRRFLTVNQRIRETNAAFAKQPEPNSQRPIVSPVIGITRCCRNVQRRNRCAILGYVLLHVIAQAQ
jgi:hypothetical protein